METNKAIEEILEKYFAEGVESFLPHVAVNCVVLGYDHPNLKVLVFRLPGQEFCSLPGGYIKNGESIDDAAYRNLKLSGIDQVFLRQIQTFGDPFRVTRLPKPGVKNSSKKDKIMRWVTQRFVTVVYYGLVRYSNMNFIPGGLSMESRWLSVNKLENLIQDHAKIICQTRDILGTELLNYPVSQNLLPDLFTMNELRGLYEAILDRRIDRGTFRRKMLQQGVIAKVNQRKDVVGRPADVYRFNQKTYKKSLTQQTKFGF